MMRMLMELIVRFTALMALSPLLFPWLVLGMWFAVVLGRTTSRSMMQRGPVPARMSRKS